MSEELLENVKNGNTEEVSRLLDEEGVDVSVVDDRRRTPLHLACEKGHTGIAQLLIDHGADVSVVDNYGNTPLHDACYNGHRDIVQLLIDHGADVSVVDNNGITPLSITFKNDQLHLLPLFRQVYIQQQLLLPPQLISFPNHNIFSPMRLKSARYLCYYLRHPMSSLRIKGYMDNRGLLRNGMRELVVKFLYGLSLEEDEGRECGYRLRINLQRITQECHEALLFWKSEGEGYYIR